MYNKTEIAKSLKKIAIKKGDNLFINPEIFKLGIYNTKKNLNNFYQDYFDSLMNVVGKTGTLCINTYTFDTLRFNKRFVYESSSTTSGKLSNLFLKQKKTIRSLHPVFSVAAIGKNANYICNNNSHHNYGYGSPYYKFLKINGKILNIGMEPWRNPFNHVAEYLIGVPYCFNKYTDVRYYKKNKKKKIYFSSFVRYLNIDLVSNYKKLKNKLSESKIVKKVALGDGHIYLYNSKQYMDLCLNILTDNQLAFIDAELYKKSLLK